MKTLRITLIATLLLATFSLTSCTSQDLNEEEALQTVETDVPDSSGGGAIDE